MADVQTREQRTSVPWSVWRLVRFVVGRVIVAPVAAGRPKDNGWPAGLHGIVAVWAVLYAAMAAAAALGSQIRRHSPLVTDGVTTLPTAAIPLVLVAFVFGLTCLYTAGLHLVWWLRLPVTLVVVAFLLRPVDLSDVRALDVPALAAAALLVVLLAVRWGRAFHWLEFVAALFVIGHGLLTEVVFAWEGTAGYASEPRLNTLFLLAGFAWCLAVPAGLVAGAAVAELTVSTVAWTVTGTWQALGSRRHWSPAWGIAAVALVGVVRVAQIGWHVWRDDPEYRLANALPSVGHIAVVLVACALVARRADHVHRGDPPVRPDPDDVVARWSGWSLVLAVILGVAFGGPLLVSNLLKAYGLAAAGEAVQHTGASWQFTVLALAGAIAALCAAFVLSGRGQRVAAILLTAFGVQIVSGTVVDRLNLLPSFAGITVGTTLAALALFCWLAARRRLSAVRGAALATVLVLSGVYEYRDVLEEPLTAAFSLVGVSAAVLVGLVWRMLTDSGYSRGDSARFPRPSRVLVALASTMYAVTSIGVVGLVGGDWPYDVALLEEAGDGTLGIVLASAAFFAGLSLAARGRLVRADPPRDDYGKLVAPPR